MADAASGAVRVVSEMIYAISLGGAGFISGADFLRKVIDGAGTDFAVILWVMPDDDTAILAVARSGGVALFLRMDGDFQIYTHPHTCPHVHRDIGVVLVVRIDAEVVRTEDVGFPGFDLESSGIEFLFPNFDRDKIGASWSTGPVWGLSDISLSAYYQAVNKESASTFDFPGFLSKSFTTSEIDSLGFNAQSIADVGKHRLTFGLDFYRDQVDDEAFSQACFGADFCPFPPSILN